MIINKSGIAIRLPMTEVRVMGRATQGVRLINLVKRNDEIASACVVEHEDPEDELTDESVTDAPIDTTTDSTEHQAEVPDTENDKI